MKFTNTKNLTVKLYCSCIRNPDLVRELKQKRRVYCPNAVPSEGDVVLVRVISLGHTYSHVENQHGRDQRIYPNDVIVGVLGTRYSATNVSGVLPTTVVKCGDRLALVSVGGLIAEIDHIPNYYGKSPTVVEVIGFYKNKRSSGVINLSRYQSLGKPRAKKLPDKIIFVFGTSAEAGKTTFMCQFIHRLTARGGRVGAAKISGTGRLRDLLSYSDAGAEMISDFVDYGWASTYAVKETEYRDYVNTVLNAFAGCEYALLEIGGDVIEHHARLVVQLAAKHARLCVIVANDTVGAFGASVLLKDEKYHGEIVFATLRQNASIMAQRLGVEHVCDLNVPESVSTIAKNL